MYRHYQNALKYNRIFNICIKLFNPKIILCSKISYLVLSSSFERFVTKKRQKYE